MKSLYLKAGRMDSFPPRDEMSEGFPVAFPQTIRGEQFV